ncbi:MAG: GNAT family N-acetyltransferase [Candidatus Wallbacteria bacterium]|nr:GNAT family N-acetyltransferase [Candidatus Wallbacteria bacterium]
MTELKVRRICRELIPDFYTVHSPESGEGWCNCVAWHVPTWDGWDQRSAEQNRSLRDELFSRGEFDGYLLYSDGVPVGWCQAGPRDRLPKLLSSFGLIPEPGTWAITCMVIIPSSRGKGLCAQFLLLILDEMKTAGIKKIEAYPKQNYGSSPGEAWLGPLQAYEKAGFRKMGEVKGNALMVAFPAPPDQKGSQT